MSPVTLGQVLIVYRMLTKNFKRLSGRAAEIFTFLQTFPYRQADFLNYRVASLLKIKYYAEKQNILFQF